MKRVDIFPAELPQVRPGDRILLTDNHNANEVLAQVAKMSLEPGKDSLVSQFRLINVNEPFVDFEQAWKASKTWAYTPERLKYIVHQEPKDVLNFPDV